MQTCPPAPELAARQVFVRAIEGGKVGTTSARYVIRRLRSQRTPHAHASDRPLSA
jgi:hypothetical protein